jgi:putative nucleotidyltransferase with HDIG domain
VLKQSGNQSIINQLRAAHAFMIDKLDNYIEKVKNLPVTPTVMVRLVALFQQPDRDVDDIVNLMRQDPSLTAEVLRHSNSAYFGHDEPIVDVFEAITRVGFYEVYKTAVAKLGSQTLQAQRGASSADVEKLWRHSSLTAVTSGVIARRTQADEGLAFTAGLLHDVGKIVLSLAEGPKYTAMVRELGEGGPPLQGAEALLFGFGHSEVGARLLAKWGLPEEISVPVLHHHKVCWVEPFERICAVVSLGNIMAHGIDASIPGQPYDSQESLCAMRVLRLEEDDMAALLEDAQSDVKQMAGLLGAAAK